MNRGFLKLTLLVRPFFLNEYVNGRHRSGWPEISTNANNRKKMSRPELNEIPAALPEKLPEALVFLVNLFTERLKIISN